MLEQVNLLNHIILPSDIVTEITALLKDVPGKKIFVLTDENTLEHCYPLIKDAFLDKVNIIKIRSGESQKNMETLHRIWDKLFDCQADRKAVLLNLGGGVITDIGGFAASTYKRGINFINIPTTLLAQVDAAIGGKNGINYGKLKNQIGTILLPLKVVVSPKFLKTLPKREILNGFAEMLKHGYISDAEHLSDLWKISEKIDNEVFDSKEMLSVLEKSMDVKLSFVKSDFTEQGPRKALNFGHTFGHAFESLYKDSDTDLLHGEAVAQGMICELALSTEILGFDSAKRDAQINRILSIYEKLPICNQDFDSIIHYMKYDKKNIDNAINFTLLKNLGIAVTDCLADEKTIRKTLLFYTRLSK